MFDRPDGGERALLVHIDFKDHHERTDLKEFQELVLSAGAFVLGVVTGTRLRPDAQYFVGTGKAEEIAAEVKTHQCDLIIFDHTLTPAQTRNLEKLCECRVLDRTGLILDIFAKRARSFEGQLQVELAQLNYLSTRLVRGWTHLERQRGGGIGMTGPGEKQLELDRRLIRNRIKQITQKLEKVKAQRQLGRTARKRSGLPVISLVGYTNAGKSTLFNRLTSSDVFAENLLFATLDPTYRKFKIPKFGEVILIDTVGFISHLPHQLVNAFHATLEETVQSDLILHVIDAADPAHEMHIAEVEKVLAEIGATDVPLLQVLNKIDSLDVAPRVDYHRSLSPSRIWISAQTGAGIPLLEEAILASLTHQSFSGTLCLLPAHARLRALLYQQGAVESERSDERGCCWMEVTLPKADLDRLLLQEGLSLPELTQSE